MATMFLSACSGVVIMIMMALPEVSVRQNNAAGFVGHIITISSPSAMITSESVNRTSQQKLVQNINFIYLHILLF